MASEPSTSAILIGTAIIAAVSGYMLGIYSSLGFLPIPFSSGGAGASAHKTSSASAAARKYASYADEEESTEEEVEDALLDHAPNWAQGLEADRRGGLSAAASRNAGGDGAAVTSGTGTAEGKGKGKGKDQSSPDRQDWEMVDSREECKLVLVVRSDLGMGKGKIAAQCSHATLACYKAQLRRDARSPVLRRWERQGQAKVALKVDDEDELLLLMAQAQSLGLVAEVIADAGRTQIEAGSRTVLGIGPAPVSVVNQVTGKLKLL